MNGFISQNLNSNKSIKNKQSKHIIKLFIELIKQIYERENSKVRRNQMSEFSSIEKSKQIINTSATNHTCSYITPHQLFKSKNNLTDY